MQQTCAKQACWLNLEGNPSSEWHDFQRSEANVRSNRNNHTTSVHTARCTRVLRVWPLQRFICRKCESSNPSVHTSKQNRVFRSETPWATQHWRRKECQAEFAEHTNARIRANVNDCGKQSRMKLVNWVCTTYADCICIFAWACAYKTQGRLRGIAVFAERRLWRTFRTPVNWMAV